MEAKDLIRYMREPGQMNRETALQLKELLDEYPCFTVARMLYLKNLLDIGDVKFSKNLIRTAISVPDRRRLYYFVEGKPLPENRAVPKEEPDEEGSFSIIDRFLNEAAGDPNFESLPDSGEDASVQLSPAEEEWVEDVLTPDDYTSSITANEPDLTEESFTFDYMDYLSRQADMLPDEASVVPMQGQDLIDRFLDHSDESFNGFQAKVERAPAIPKAEGAPFSPKAERAPSMVHSERTSSEAKVVPETASSVIDPFAAGMELPEHFELELNLPEDSFTETLAKIYLKQKRYDRALEIFKSLSLKYPEKNVYFADQIRFLEKLIINITNK